MSKHLHVKVDREKWYRGHGSDFSALVVEDDPDHEGEMCCLGFAGLDMGYDGCQMGGARGPDDLACRLVDNDEIPAKDFHFVLKKLIEKPTSVNADDPFVCSSIAGQLMEINDTCLGGDIESEKDREKQIKDLGKKAGISYSFFN